MAVESLFGQGRSNGEEIDVQGDPSGGEPGLGWVEPWVDKAVESAGLGL